MVLRTAVHGRLEVLEVSAHGKSVGREEPSREMSPEMVRRLHLLLLFFRGQVDEFATGLIRKFKRRSDR